MKLLVTNRQGISTLLLIFSLIYLFQGCALLKLKRDSVIGDNTTIFVGKVTSNTYNEKPIFIAAYCITDTGRVLTNYRVLHKQGTFDLLVYQEEKYILWAFVDINNNNCFDTNEPSGYYKNGKIINSGSSGIFMHLDITLSMPKSDYKNIDSSFAIQNVCFKNKPSNLSGAVISLDNEMFSKENGKNGYWAPAEFYKNVGGNIYFNREFDPQKIPILFIHGALRTPRDFQIFIKNIDTTRYQPCFFYYPSGLPLTAMSNLLLWKLFNLFKTYKIDEMCITAHSMGGLIARYFLIHYGKYFPSINLFIAISSPWSGVISAEKGVKHSPVIVPSWRELQPNGPFIKALFQKQLPKNIEYYMLFGHKLGKRKMRYNNDGTIALASILDNRSQSEAKMIYGFEEDHTSILKSNDMFTRYNMILDNYYNDTPASNVGMLQIGFTFKCDDSIFNINPILKLIPHDSLLNEEVIFLNINDSGKIFGPFANGKYTASIIAPAFKPIPLKTDIVITSNDMPKLHFDLSTDGVLFGSIVNNSEYYDNITGSYKPLNKDFKFSSIVLRGNNIYREIIYTDRDEPDYLNNQIFRNDFAFGKQFYFFDLETGTYTLEINADGFKQSITKHNVIRGVLNGFKKVQISAE